MVDLGWVRFYLSKGLFGLFWAFVVRNENPQLFGLKFENLRGEQGHLSHITSLMPFINVIGCVNGDDQFERHRKQLGILFNIVYLLN